MKKEKKTKPYVEPYFEEIWLAGMEPTDYLLKMTGGAKSDPDDAK